MRFALTYVIDPHPLAPDPSPYRGAVWELEYSKFRQATSFAERLSYAFNVSTAGVFDDVMIDFLEPRNASGNNALWCSWGPAPNAAWLIGRNGTVVLAQTWFNASEMNDTLRAFA